jgi:hypothetical protein
VIDLSTHDAAQKHNFTITQAKQRGGEAKKCLKGQKFSLEFSLGCEAQGKYKI